LKTFTELETSEQWIFLGNIFCSIGALAISIGTVVRLAADGKLPTGRPVANTATDSGKEPNLAQDYFS
jgi:hypothetical protein